MSTNQAEIHREPSVRQECSRCREEDPIAGLVIALREESQRQSGQIGTVLNRMADLLQSVHATLDRPERDATRQ